MVAIRHCTCEKEERAYMMLLRNLNWVCPKDEFPLPNMDLLIDSAVGNAMFSFMDGFSGFNVCNLLVHHDCHIP